MAVDRKMQYQCSWCLAIKLPDGFWLSNDEKPLYSYCKECAAALKPYKVPQSGRTLGQSVCGQCGKVGYEDGFCRVNDKPTRWCVTCLRDCSDQARARAHRMGSIQRLCRKCAMCGETKPVNDFPRSKGNSDGLHSYCKTCNNKIKKEYFRSVASRNRLLTKSTGTKMCRRCGTTGAVTSFHLHVGHKDGRDSLCKSCRSHDSGKRWIKIRDALGKYGK